MIDLEQLREALNRWNSGPIDPEHTIDGKDIIRNITEAAQTLLKLYEDHPGIQGIIDGTHCIMPAKHMKDGVVLAGLTHKMSNAFWNAYSAATVRHGHYESTNAGYEAMRKASGK